MNLFLVGFFSVNTEDDSGRQLKYSLKKIKILSSWYFRVVLRFLKENEKNIQKFAAYHSQDEKK